MRRLAALAAVVALGITPGSLPQVHRLVAASTSITKLTPAQGSALANLPSQSADKLYNLPGLCEPATCVLGDKHSHKLAVVYGDSHARMWLPAMLPYLTAKHFRVVVLGQDGCPAVDWWRLSPTKCDPIRTAALAQIAKLKPAVTIISNYTGIGVDPANIRHPTYAQWVAGLKILLGKIAGRKIVVGDITQLTDDPSACLATYPANVQTCSVANPNPAYPTLQGAERRATKAMKVPYIETRPWLCAKRCSPVIGQYLAYWSSNHVSVQYAAYLASVMGAALKAAL